jgi:hypothetical protein
MKVELQIPTKNHDPNKKAPEGNRNLLPPSGAESLLPTAITS